MPSRRVFLAFGGIAALGVGAYAGAGFLAAPAAVSTAMTPSEALAAAEAGDIILIDIRRPDEWQMTGVGQPAHPIDMRSPQFIEMVKSIHQHAMQPVAVICARGVRSARMTHQLVEAGIAHVIDIPEGMLGSSAGPGWLARGLPVKSV